MLRLLLSILLLSTSFSYGYHGNLWRFVPNVIKDFLSKKRSEPVEKAKDQQTRVGLLLIDQEVFSAGQVLGSLIPLFADPSIDAIVLAIDTYLYLQIAGSLIQDIQTLKKMYNKPVIAYAQTKLVSSSYMLACCCDMIVAAPISLVGGIISYWNTAHKHLKHEADGIEHVVLYAGKFKCIGNADVAPFEQSYEYKQAWIDHLIKQMTITIEHFRPQIMPMHSDWIEGQEYNVQAINEHIPFVDMIGNQNDVGMLINKYLNQPADTKIEWIVKRLFKAHEEPDAIETWGCKDTADWCVALVQVSTDIKVTSWQTKELLEQFFADPSITGIILHIDCDGSDIACAHNFSEEITFLKKKYNKPVVAYVNTSALSGGYYIACSADHIIAAPFAEIGSVGTRRILVDMTKKQEKDQIVIQRVVSGQYADLWDNRVPLTEQKRQLVQNIINKYHQQFIDYVVSKRPGLQVANQGLWDQAQIYCADQAVEIGLIDTEGSFLDALAYLKIDVEQITEQNGCVLQVSLPVRQEKS